MVEGVSTILPRANLLRGPRNVVLRNFKRCHKTSSPHPKGCCTGQMFSLLDLQRWLLSWCLATALVLAANPVATTASSHLNAVISLETSLEGSSLSISQEVMNVNSFGFRLLQKLSNSRASDSDGNVFLSPVSVSTALAMAGVGATINSASLGELEAAFGGMNLLGIATENGSREHAMTRLLEDALGSQWDEGSGVELTMANGGWYKASVLPRFKVGSGQLFQCARVSV